MKMQISKKTIVISSIVALVVLAACIFGVGYTSYSAGHQDGMEQVYLKQSMTSVLTIVNQEGNHTQVHILDLCSAIFESAQQQQ